MRIKRLEIHGFKSFVDKTQFNFGGGMTAVVGPNGCGKSNIVDAVLWCMGEQSPKHLRGKDMQDVIFAGSESRPPAGMAEVSLFFAMDEGPAIVNDPLAVDVPLAPVEGMKPKKSIEQLEAEAEEAARRAGLGPEMEESANAEAQEEGAAAPEPAPAADAPIAIPEFSAAEAAADLAPKVTDAPIKTLHGFTEVQVTRRLYRSGESEYLMNKTPCRLRDIHELFMDAGIGKGAYSIIEQGKVGMIVSSKPEDRRIFIEEAAGISKFKTRKKQALSKIEQTEQNLLRVNDIVTELAKQMGSLDRQAKKAERYRKLRDEIREVDLKVAAGEYDKRTRDFGAEQAALAELKEREIGATAELASVEGDVENARGRLADEERELSGVQEQLFAANNQIKLDQQNLDYAIREIEKTRQTSETAKADVSRLEADIAHIGEETARSLADREALDAEIAEKTAAIAAQAGQVEDGKRASRELSEKIEEIRTRVAEALHAMTSARNHIAHAEKRQGDLRTRLERGQSERDEVAERVESSRRAAGDAATALAGLKQMKLGLEHEREEHAVLFDTLKLELTAAQAEAQALADDLSRKKTRLQSLTELQNSYEGYQKGVRSVMARAGVTGSSLGPDDDAPEPEGPATDGGATMTMAADGAAAVTTLPAVEKPEVDPGVYGLVADLISTPQRFETAVEAVLGERLQAVLVKSHVEGVDAVRFLREQAAGRGTFLPLHLAVPEEGTWPDLAQEGVLGRLLDQVHVRPEYMDVAKMLLGDVIVVDSLERAVALHAQEKRHRRSYVTLEGELVAASGALTGGSREGLATGLLQRKREIKELTKQVSELEQSTAQRTLAREQLVKRVAQVEEALKALTRSEQEESYKILSHEKDLSTLQERLERDRQRQEVLEFEAGGLRRELDEAGEERATAEKQIAEETAKKEAGELELIAVQEKAREAQSGIEQLVAAETHLKVAVAETRSRRDSLVANLQRLERNHQELEARIARLKESIERGAKEEADLTEQAASLEAAVELRTKESEALRMQLLEMREKFDAESHALREREASIKNVRTQLEQLKAAIGQSALREKELEMNLQHLVQQTAERYNEDLAANWQTWVDPTLDLTVTAAQVAELKEKISKLGEVNLTAIEEHAEVAARHDELAKQKEDLEQTLAQLKETIAKINRTSKERFIETFEKVNKNFQELFPKLFRGGKAHLVLTNETDLLESGVDIIAQPPGKKLQNINLLSGGEKALTAVSLIVAIFLVRPTPFCVLDEVDAPLDEANVGRYNDIVREMANNTQFIVITHNKRTMAVCDALYGITMEEPGCSRTVTVKFDGEKMRQRVDAPAPS